eukprot:1192694-Prorocentrum_minimum.AAC.5
MKWVHLRSLASLQRRQNGLEVLWMLERLLRSREAEGPMTVKARVSDSPVGSRELPSRHGSQGGWAWVVPCRVVDRAGRLHNDITLITIRQPQQAESLPQHRRVVGALKARANGGFSQYRSIGIYDSLTRKDEIEAIVLENA